MKDINKLLEERKGNLQETLNAIQSLQSQLQQAQEQALILKGAIAQLEELNKEDIEEEQKDEPDFLEERKEKRRKGKHF